MSYGENNKELSRYSIKTIGEPHHLKLTFMHGPKGLFADGADLAILQVEVVDANGDRCPLADNMIKFDLQDLPNGVEALRKLQTIMYWLKSFLSSVV